MLLNLLARVRTALATFRRNFAARVPARPSQNTCRLLAILFVALIFCWPAILNHLPLIFPDSIEYLSDGRPLIEAILHRPHAYFLSQRSETYSIAIFLLDWNRSLWPIVAAQALVTSWVLWLVVRSLCRRRPEARFLAIAIALSLITSMAWYVSFIMPDILGSILYLSIYLLVFAWQGLRRWETAALILIACGSTLSHSSHLLVASGLCVLLAIFQCCRWRGMSNRGRQLALVSSILLFAIATQVALHAWIYHEPTVFGRKPPFLMARALADGPARLYLQRHCGNLHWTICTHVDNLPHQDWEFLWVPDGIWNTSTPEQKQHLLHEELPLVLATIRSYPAAQARSSLANFYRQITMVGPIDFVHFPFFTPENLDSAIPGLALRYQSSLQSRNRLPQHRTMAIQTPALILSILVLAALLPGAWRHRQNALLGLTAIILFAIVANAFVTGALAGVTDRTEGRTVWLLLLAAFLHLASWNRNQPETASPPHTL